MGSPGTRRAKRRHMLGLRKAKEAAKNAAEHVHGPGCGHQAEPAVVEEPVVVQAAEPVVVEEVVVQAAEPVVVEEVEAPKEGLLKKAMKRGHRKKTEQKSGE